MTRLFPILLCLATAGLSQPVSVGAKGGLRLTGDRPEYGTSNSKRYLVGPMLEVRLPFHFAIEADALYSRLGNTYEIPLIANESIIRTIADSWEFPALVKYRLPGFRVHPYLSVGVAPRRAGGTINTIHYGYYAGDVTFSSVDWHAHDHAIVLGGGTEARLGPLRLSPEIRYVRWKVPTNPSSWNVSYYLSVPQNEAQLMLGIGLP